MGTRIISFFYVIYLAKVLGVSQFGLFTAALAYFSIISAVSDLGFNRFLIREVAKDKSRAGELLSNILILRLTLSSILFSIFAIVLYLLDPNATRVSLTLLAVLAIIPQTAVFTFDAVFTAFQKLEYAGAGLFFSGLVTVLSGYYLVGRGFGVFGAVSALIIGQIFYAVLLFLLLFRNGNVSFSSVKLTVFKKAIIGSLPYGLLGVLGLLYFRIDALLLSYLRGSFETGIYGAGYKFLEAVVFIPGAFSAALFPALARLHDADAAEMKKLYFKSLKLMFFSGFLTALAYFLILPMLISLYLPNYLQSIKVIQILSFAIPFIFIAAPGVQVLFSSEKYLKSVIFFSILTVSFNIILNLIFIPKYGFLAAAWITVASEIISFVIFFLLIRSKYLGRVR